MRRLLECFARAFDCYDPQNRKIDDSKLATLAEDWEGVMLNETLEAEDFLKTLQAVYAESNANPADGPKPAGPLGGMP